ncbi:MAG: AAA family ATPase [Candidatus Cloacimonetes bacterium]|nr:AAA family ATPase [Candidatus Cloacimonadota bacterium]
MKISIPRETLDKIMKDFGVSEEKATRLYLSAFDDAESYFWDSIEEKMADEGISSVKKSNIQLYTPREVKAFLDKYIIGQEEYKKRIAIASAFHFSMIKIMRSKDHGLRRFRKKNTLIAGPSGSGKTYCIEVLGDLIDVPTLIVDATDYTEAGYVGKSADDMIRELIDMAPGATKKEQAQYINKNGAIVFIDELDKKAREGSGGHDISREGFQRAILKLIERKQVSIENPMSPSAQIQDMMDKQKGKGNRLDNVLSTENILFILGGSFQRGSDPLENIIKKRISRGPGSTDEDGNLVIGGFTLPDERKDESFKNLYPFAEEADYIKFGIIPELVGRTPIRSYVNHLSKNDLMRIMNDTEDSLLRQYQLEFESFGIDLQFTDDAIEFVAEKAERQKTGARALIGVWEDILTDFQYELPGSEHKSLLINREVCDTPKDYLLKILSRNAFDDYIKKFQGEMGIEIFFSPEAKVFAENYAKSEKLQLSDALSVLLAGASAINYIGHQGRFEITLEVLENPKYFDDLYMNWHKERFSKVD